MTTKWLRRERVKTCTIHKAVMAEATAELSIHGVFSKDDILASLGYECIEGAIRWDYVRELIQLDHDCEIVPLAASFFKHHSRVEEQVNPTKFLASGHGKKTAGYAAVVPSNDHLVIARLKQRKAMIAGSQEKFDTKLQKIQAKRGGQPLLGTDAAE